MDSEIYLGLDIGGTKSAAILGNSQGRILDRQEFPSHAARGPDAMIADLLARSQTLLSRTAPKPRAVGVSIGGPLDTSRGIILGPPNLPGWDNIPLKEILEQRFAIPVHIEHDAAACALAEYRWGAGKNAARLIYLTCATGFGAGLVFDGKIYRGANGLHPEISHARYRPDGPTAFGKAGSYEAFASATGLSRIAAWLFPQRWAAAPPAPAHVAELFAAGDPGATQVVTENAHAVASACAFLADTLRPDLILLGSLAHYLGQPWLELVRTRFAQECLPASHCPIMPTALGPRLQDCSALVVALP